MQDPVRHRFDSVLRLLIAFVALVAVACGSDGGGKPGSDAEYVDGFCRATLRANERSQVLPMAPGERISSENLQAMGTIYEDFATDLSKLRPPADLKDFHDRWVVEWKKAAKQMKTGDTSVDPFLALEQMEPPQSVAARFQAAAEANEICKKAGVNFKEQNASTGTTPLAAESRIAEFASALVSGRLEAELPAYRWQPLPR